MAFFVKDQFLWNFFKNSKGLIPKYYEYVNLDSKKCINKSPFTEHSSKIIYISLFPDFFNSKLINQEKYNLIKVPHYGMDGAAMYFNKDYTYETYQKEFIKKSFQKTFRRSIKRLESCFNIRYEFNYGEISEEKCNYLLGCFREMLKRRFEEKETQSVFMSEWESNIKNLTSLINQKKSSLFVIYNDNTPISISLVRHIDKNISFAECHAYNIDYSKFSLGHIDNYLLLNWCINNNVYFLDLGLGNLDYKGKWCNKFYKIEYHIYYKKNDILSKIIVKYEVLKIKLKNFIKKNKIDIFLSKLKTRLNKTKPKNPNNDIIKYSIEEIEASSLLSKSNLSLINKSDIEKITYRMLYDFLYSYNEHIDNVSIYKSLTNNSLFFIKGKNNAIQLTF